jgi:PAS domain S-box-containing protein
VRELAESAGVSETGVFDMQVAVSEAVANAIEHAQSEVEIEAWILRDRIIFEITNDGYFRPGTHKETGERRRGLGMPIMATLSDQMHFARLSGDRTMVSLTFLINPTAATAEPPAPPVPLATKSEPTSGPKPVTRRFRYWVWFPVALFAFVLVLGKVLPLKTFFPPSPTFAALGTLFCSGSGFAIAYLAARTFVTQRARSALSLGAGGVFFGMAYLASGIVAEHLALAPALNIPVMVAAGAMFCLTAFWSASDATVSIHKSVGRLLFISYGSAIGFGTFIIVLVLTGVIPLLGSDTAGSSLYGRIALDVVVIAFAAGAAGLAVLSHLQPSRFLVWFSASMALIAIALFPVAILPARSYGSLLPWIGTGMQYLGGIYLLMAVLSPVHVGYEIVLPLRRELQQTRESLQALILVSPSAIWLQSEGRFLFANSAAAAMFGVRNDSTLVGRQVLDLVPTESRQAFADWLDGIYSLRVTAPHYQNFMPAEGSMVETEVVAARVEIEEGPALMVVAHDIGDLKEVERALRNREEDYRGLAVENARTLQSLEIELENVRVLSETAKVVHASLDPQQMASLLLKTVETDLHPLQGSFYYTESGDLLRNMSSFGYGEEAAAPATISVSDSTNIGYALTHRLDYLPQDVAPRPSEGPLSSDDTAATDRWIILPLQTKERLLGAMVLSFTGRRSFEAGEISLYQAIAFQASLALQNARLFTEQKSIAEHLQQALLDVPDRIDNIDIGHVYHSAAQYASVGGDFYDVFAVLPDRIALIIGDVSGQGVEAARLAGQVKDTIRALAHHFRGDPASVLEETNRVLVERPSPDYVTAFLGFLDLATGTLTYSSAGHPGPLIMTRDTAPWKLDVAAPPLGAFPDSRYSSQEASLSADTMLLAFTDGVTEARFADQHFGEERLAAALSKYSDLPVAEIPKRILEEVLSFSQGILADDVALLAVRLRPATLG